MIRVVLVDDHAVVRAGYRRLLECDEDMVVIQEFERASTAYTWLGEHAADIVVLDLSLRDESGLDWLRRICARSPAQRVLVFSMHDAPTIVRQALSSGAAGYVTKSTDPNELTRAMRWVVNGRRQVVSSDLSEALLNQSGDPELSLSPRELEVYRCLVQGKTIDEIARCLHVSPKTVSNHQTSIRQGLGVSTAFELLRLAQEHGFASLGHP